MALALCVVFPRIWAIKQLLPTFAPAEPIQITPLTVVMPAPEAIKLYDPYNNRECLHCHLGARSFEEGAVHTADPDLLPAVKANKISCLSSGCHDVVHNIGQLNNVKFWNGGK